MNIKILTSIPEKCNKRNMFIIGTHNGIFHSDEVVAIAILCLLHETDTIFIIRTRDEETLKKCDICVDVGGGEFDHHQAGGNGNRTVTGFESPVPFASSGLIWHSFGYELIKKIVHLSFHTNIDVTSDVFDDIDKKIISLIDLEDNGITTITHCFNFIPSFLPSWIDFNQDYESSFYDVLNVTIKILYQKIIEQISLELAFSHLHCRWQNKDGLYFESNILEIPSQTIPWLETITFFNSLVSVTPKNIIKFVIFPYPNGGWAAQCVPPSLERKFEQLVPFPKEWAGQTIELPNISGISDATFCHNGCFFIRAQSKESIIQMCKIAIKLSSY